MKKVLLVVLLFAAIAAAVFFALRGGGAPPAVADAVPASEVAAMGGGERLDALARRWMPLASLVDPSFDEGRVLTALGFDPRQPEGWQSMGIDPSAGIGLGVDARVKNAREPLPIALVKITDEAKALAWLSARLEAPATLEGEGAVRTLVSGENRTLIGRRGPWTAVLLANQRDLEVATPGFTAFVEDAGAALADEAIFRDAFAGADAPLLFAWGGAANTGDLATAFAAPEEVSSTIDFYGAMFPATAAWLGEAGGGARLLATEKGIALLRKLFVPQRGAPKTARFVAPKGWAALRFSYNLAEVLDGVAEAMPPAAAQAKAAVGMVRMMLPMAAGVTWDDITAALSGHVVLAGDLLSLDRFEGGGGMPDGLLMLGVTDGAKADALIGKALDRARAKVPGIEITEAEIGGEKGRRVAMGPMQWAVVRLDDVILAGGVAAVEAALKRADGEHLSGPGADALDGDAMWAAVADLEPLLAQAAERPEAAERLNHPALAPLKQSPRVALTVHLDRSGLVWRGAGPVPGDVLAAAFVAAGRAWDAAAAAPPPAPEAPPRPLQPVAPAPDPFPANDP